MKKWLLLILLGIGLALLGFSANWWLPPFLAFIGANSDVIQGLTDFIQLLLWLGAAIIGMFGWFTRRQENKTPPIITPTNTHTATASGQANIGQDGSTVGGQVAVKGNVEGDIIIISPEQLWQAIDKKPPSPDLRTATTRYLEHLVERYQYLDFRGMGVSDRIPLRLPLVEMYVPLKARIEMPEGETWARELRLAGRQMSQDEVETIGQRLSEPQYVLELLQKNDGLIILGDPGAGKTTFLKMLTLRLASNQNQSLNLGARLPILIPLSAYANSLAEKDIPLDKFIPAYYQDRGIELPLDAMLTEALRKGGALLLLDGLDEVKDLSRRRIVVDRVEDFFTFHRRQGNKFILTSRIVGYKEVRPAGDGLMECTLADFETEDIKAFIDKWTSALERAARGRSALAQQEAQQEAQDLLNAVRANKGVSALASNPLLLTILALMKRQGVTLPERRVELYQKYIETLLKTWNLARGLGRPASRDLDVVETVRLLAPLALWMHQTSPGVGLVKREPLRRKLIEICTERQLEDPEQAAQQLLADVREHAGLLLERGAGEYGFIHLTFQEYLAAVAIAQQGQDNLESVINTLSAHVGDDNWHEVTLLTIGYMGIIQQLDRLAGRVTLGLSKSSVGEPGQAVVLAGEAVVDAWPGGVDPQSREEVRQYLMRAMIADQHIKPLIRAAAGDTLAQLGDPRSGVSIISLPRQGGRAGEGVKLPDIMWQYIPAGRFIMGSVDDSLKLYGSETPQHGLDLPDYYLSRYPVTNRQYGVFVEDGGYSEKWRHCWTKGGWADKGERLEPRKYGGVYDLPNHPVVMVSWYEGVAYCNWLNEKYQQRGFKLQVRRNGNLETMNLEPGTYKVRLPSEAEWEKGARGTDGRTYPWGEELDSNRANYDDTGIGSTSAVGCFAGGVSPYGCEDMSGNVWEWCSTVYKEKAYPYQVGDEWADKYLAGGAGRVLRGGAFNYYYRFVRCAVRLWDDPYLRYDRLGFRVVLSPLSL